MGPGAGDVAFEHGADGHFYDVLGSVGVAVDFVEADIVFAVFGSGEDGHDRWMCFGCSCSCCGDSRS